MADTMNDTELALLNAGLSAWASEAVNSYGAKSVYLFGSLIHKRGIQFNDSSDVDLVLVMPERNDALARHRWLEEFRRHQEDLELMLMRSLGRAALEPSASIVAVTELELSYDVHKDGHRQFFVANTFRDLVAGTERGGIDGSGSATADRFVTAALGFAQKIRNEYLAVSANRTPRLRSYEGADPLPKRMMRAAAMAARAAGETNEPGAEHDVREGLDVLSNTLYHLRNNAPLYRELQDVVSVRRGARGRHKSLEATNQLLLAELIYDLAATSKTRSASSDLQPQRPHIIDKLGRPQTEQNKRPSGPEIQEEGMRAGRTPMPLGSTTAFFAERFASAFPGVRSIAWYGDSSEIETRLLMLLRAPLSFSDQIPIWWWRGGNLHIETFEKISASTFLMNVEEIRVASIAAVPGSTYQRTFIYVQTAPMTPTGLYPDLYSRSERLIEENGYVTEEYGLYGETLLTRAEYDDGATMLDGKIIQTSGQAELRVRYLSPYNFVIAANGSPINNPDFDFELEQFLNAALKGDQVAVVRELSKAVNNLPLRGARLG